MIYFLQSLDKIKIGYTNNGAIERKRQMETGNPHGIVIIGTVKGNDTHEHKMHRDLEEYCVIGEWFKDCTEVRTYITDILEKKNDLPIKIFGMDEFGTNYEKDIVLGDAKWVNTFKDNFNVKSNKLSLITQEIRDIEIQIHHLLAKKKILETKYIKSIKN